MADVQPVRPDRWLWRLVLEVLLGVAPGWTVGWKMQFSNRLVAIAVSGLVVGGIVLLIVRRSETQPGKARLRLMPALGIILLSLSLAMLTSAFVYRELAGTSQPRPCCTPLGTVEIVSPQRTANCMNSPGDGPCLFRISGRSTGVAEQVGVVLYVAVNPRNPPGAGWYFQTPVTVDPSGSWSAFAYVGNVTEPAKSGDTIQIVAVVTYSDATVNGVPLSALTSGQAVGSLDQIKPAQRHSQTVDLTITTAA
jgi:hypothetical protein